MHKIVTLANLAESSEQEVFDHVLVHARKQGRKSLALGLISQCCYRNHQGLACFGGALMTDDEALAIHHEGYNGSSWAGLVHSECVTGTHDRLVTKLQVIHDTTDVSAWEQAFKDLANTNNLTYTPLETL